MLFLFTGVNAGVLLMNLTRLRNFNLEELSKKYYREFKSLITVGDQDILKIIFHKPVFFKYKLMLKYLEFIFLYLALLTRGLE